MLDSLDHAIHTLQSALPSETMVAMQRSITALAHAGADWRRIHRAQRFLDAGACESAALALMPPDFGWWRERDGTWGAYYSGPWLNIAPIEDVRHRDARAGLMLLTLKAWKALQ